MSVEECFEALHEQDLDALQRSLRTVTPGDLHEPDSDPPGSPILHTAIDLGTPLELFEALLDAGVPVDMDWRWPGAPFDTQFTALHHALWMDRLDVARLLLDRGADPHLLCLDVPHDPEHRAIGSTPALELLRHELDEQLARVIPAAPTLSGRWELIRYRYHWDQERVVNVPWEMWEDEPLSYSYIEFDGERLEWVDFVDGEHEGVWTRSEQRVFVMMDDAIDEATHTIDIMCRGHILALNMSDEQTGLRGPATFYHAYAEHLRGNPLRPA